MACFLCGCLIRAEKTVVRGSQRAAAATTAVSVSKAAAARISSGRSRSRRELIFSKNRYNAFVRTGLADQLHAAGIDTLVLAGLTTECCIASSAWAAFERDFHVFLADGRLRRL